MAASAPAPPLSVISDRAGGDVTEPDVRGGKAAFWDAIFRAGDDIDKLVQRTVAQLPTVGSDGLLILHDKMRIRLERLRSQLGAVPDSERIMLVLVFYFDERVMRQLPDTARLRWTPLQFEWLGSSHGGAEFYRILDRLLQDGRTPPLVFEIFYYCLNNGFVGRHAGNPDAIEAYKKHVKNRIPVPDAATPQPKQPVRRGPLPKQMHPAWYYIGTALITVFVIIMMTLLSNC